MKKVRWALMFIFVMLISACSGVQTYPNTVRAGETVNVAMGWQKQFKRSNTTVTITPSIGAPIVYLPDDPAVRAIINLYPDPVSWLIVGREIDNNEDYKSASAYATVINYNYTNGDNDWWQTTAFIDLPVTLPAGETTIRLDNVFGESISSVVEVLSSTGTADIFNVKSNGPLSIDQLTSMERSPYFEITINGPTIPYAMELEFIHLGEAHIINPRESVKSIMWKDIIMPRGEVNILKALIVPTQSQQLTNFIDFKFYIAGTAVLDQIQGAQPLQLQTAQAFDINGDPVSGVVVSLDANIN